MRDKNTRQREPRPKGAKAGKSLDGGDNRRNITERKQAQSEMQAALQRFYAVLSSMYGGVLLVGDDGRIEFANQAFCDLFDLKGAPADLIELGSSEVIARIRNAYLHPDREVARIAEIVGRGQPVKGEEVAMQGGRTLLRDFTPVSVDGKSRGRLWHHLDITERKRDELNLAGSREELRVQAERLARQNEELTRAETALSTAHERMRAVLASITEAYVAYDRDWRILEVNPVAEQKVFHRPAMELVGKVVWDEFPQTRGMETYRQFQVAFAENRPVHFETQSGIINAWFEVHAYPGPDRLDVYFHDITERKQAEAEIRRLASFPELNPSPIIEVALDGELTYLNPAATRVFPDLARARWEHPVLAGLEATIAEITSGRTLEVSRTVQVEECHYLQWLSYVAGSRRVRVYMRDVTDIRRAENALRESRSRLEVELAAMTQLQKVGLLFAQEGELEPVLTQVVDAAIAISSSDFGNIQLLDSQSGDLRIAAQRGFPQWWLEFWARAAPGQGVCGTALERGERVIVEDVEKSPIFAGTPSLEIQLRAGVRAVQSTPLVSRSGKPVGMFSTHFRKPHRPDDHVLLLLDLLARNAADIIERAQAEQAQRESEARFRSAFDDGAVAMTLTAPDLKLIRVNAAYCRLVGYSEAELVGRSVQDLTLPEDRTTTQSSLDSVVKGDAPALHFEKRYLTKDGRVIWADVSSAPVRDPAGRVLYVVTHVQDITERKQAETERTRLLAEVQAEKDRLSALVASIRDEVWFADTQKRFTLANPAALKEFALEAGGEVDVEKFAAGLEVLRPDGSPRPVEETPPLRALRGEVVDNQEEMVRTPSGGEMRYREVNAAPVKDGEGNIIGSVSVVRDITERKRAENALRESEERYRNLFETMEEGFCIIEMVFDAQGKPADYRFLKINPAFEKQTGLHDAEGKLMRSLAPDHEEHWFRIYGQIALTGEPQRFVNEARALNRWYEVYAYRVGRPEDRQVAILFNDISGAKRAEAEIRRRVEEVSAANEELTRFNRLAVDRELRMVELKQEVNDALQKAGQPPKYGAGEE